MMAVEFIYEWQSMALEVVKKGMEAVLVHLLEIRNR